MDVKLVSHIKAVFEKTILRRIFEPTEEEHGANYVMKNVIGTVS
jgi:hypothetical protein